MAVEKVIRKFSSFQEADEATLNYPVEWERLPIREDQRIEVVKGRALWLGSEAALRGYDG